MMKLIADSGSTKTDWLLTGGTRLQTQGINPFHQSEETIAAILRTELLPLLPSGGAPSQVFFYGSGCRPELQPMMEELLRQVFPQAETVEVQGDLLGAARSLCGHGEGIACILGTGANSCLYDGERIVQNTPPLGYILGDEGSGAVLGIRFFNALLKGFLPAALREAFMSETKLTEADIINKVYRQPMANRFLASTSQFIARHLDSEPLRQLVVDNFRQFFRRNLSQYRRADLPVSATGSIAWYYRDLLAEAAEAEGYVVGRIERSPLGGLAQFHA